MSYTQIDMNGQKVGLKFGYEAVKNFLVDCDENREEYFDNSSILTVFGVAALVYWAYKNNQDLKSEEAVIKMEDFEDWVLEKSSTDEGLKELGAIGKMYEESRYVKLFIRQANKAVEDTKKKENREYFEEIEIILFGEGIRPWELLKYTFADVMKTIYGIRQKQDGLRRVAHIIHCSLVTKPADAEDLWPLPFDDDKEVINAERLREYQLLKARINNKVNGN